MENSSSNTNHILVNEFVWVPTYFGTWLIIYGFNINSTLQFILAISSLFILRYILEVIFRIVFGVARLSKQVGVIAFLCQIIMWALVFGMLASHSGDA